jgi:transketolase
MHTIKPIDKEIIVKSANNMDIIVSIEEHSKIGGLGSHIASVILEERLDIKYLQIALPDTFIHIVGSQNYLREVYGLTPVQISAKILNFIKKE